MALQVTRDVLDTIEASARSASPREACGILLGKVVGGVERVSAVIEAANVHCAPETHFEIDPQTLIDAYRRERQGGAAVLGYFHSHPTGLAQPSPTDREMAAHDGKIWAICAQGDTTFWRDDVSGFSQLFYDKV